jgi:hypothetical protein
MEHKAGKGHATPVGDHGWEPLEVPGQPAEARGPGEIALHDSALGEQHKATFGFRELNDRQRQRT